MFVFQAIFGDQVEAGGLTAASFFTPAINQIELHPLLNQAALRALNAQYGVVTEAYGPLGVGKEGGRDPKASRFLTLSAVLRGERLQR